MSPTDRFIPQRELGRVSEGSYEQLISRLSEEVTKSSERLFGKACSAKVLGTFSKHAIVLSEDGQARRVKFELTSNNFPKILASEPYDVTSVDPKDSKSYVEEQAKKVVDALFEGDENKAHTTLREILPLVEERREVLGSEDMVKVVKARFSGPCAWKEAYEENLTAIHNVIGADLGLIDQNRTESKFRKLYDGSTPIEERAHYEDLVRTDLVTIVEKYQEVLRRAEVLAEKAAPLATSSNEDHQALAGFALDFQDDVSQMVGVLREVRESSLDVSARGEAHDVAAKELYKYATAAAYIEAAVGKLPNQG